MAQSKPFLRVVSREEQSSSNVTQATSARLSSYTHAPPLSDEMVVAIKSGSDEDADAAWEALYVAMGGGLRGFLQLRLRNAEDAAEGVSETFARAIGKIGSLRSSEIAGFRSWLYRIAANVATDRSRVSWRVTPREPEDRVDLLQADHGDRLIGAEEHASLWDAFATLDEDDRQVLWLRIVVGLSSDEVGKIVDKRPGAVRMQQQRALATLAGRLVL